MELQLDGSAVYLNTGGVEWKDDQPTLCFIHGASLDHSVWVLFSRYFARRGYNVVTPDLPGHGKSAGQLLPDIESMGEWVDGLLASVAKTPVALCGHSMGSLVALHAASVTPERYSHLLMLGTSYPMAVGDALLNAARDNDQAAIDMVSIFGHAYSSRLGGNPVGGINVMHSATVLMAAAGPDVMYTGLNACNDYTGGDIAAKRISDSSIRPTLVLGEEDMMTPPAATASLRTALAAEVEILSRCGHMMMAEQPEQTLQAILRALAPE